MSAKRRWNDIKIEITRKNTYENCLIETHEGGIIHVICDDIKKREDLISLISGTEKNGGICILNGIDTKEQLKEYRKKIDVVDIDKINSTLTVRNYIVFYSMITGIYNNETINKLTGLLIKNDMKDIINTPINELSNINKIIVRCLASYMKHISCLVGNGLLDGLTQIQKEIFYTFLKQYFTKNHCLCLLFDSKQHKEDTVHNISID